MDELTELFNIEVNEFQKKAKVITQLHSHDAPYNRLWSWASIYFTYLKVTNVGVFVYV